MIDRNSFLALALVAATSCANAAAIITSDIRQVCAGVVSDGFTTSRCQTAPGAVLVENPFVVGFSAGFGAQPTSIAMPTQFEAIGNSSSATQVIGNAGANALSDYEVGFDLLTPHTFTLTGNLSSVASIASAFFADSASANASATLSLGALLFQTSAVVSGTGTITPTTDNDVFVISESGALAPGSYVLSVRAASNGGVINSSALINVASDSAFSFLLTLDEIASPIPEPSNLALLGIGLAGLVFSRRRRSLN